MKIKLASVKSSELTKKQKRIIYLLKDTYWKFGIRSQEIWFKKNIAKNDLHNLLYINEVLIGYTVLRKKFYINKLKKKIPFLIFDTLIVKKQFRLKKISNLLMNFNNIIMMNNNCLVFLVCKKKLKNFYEKFGWRLAKYKECLTFNNNSSTNICMVFNGKKNK